MINALSFKFKAKVRSYPGYNAYNFNFFSNIVVYLKWKINNYFKFKNFAIYNSYNVKDFFLPNLNSAQKLKNTNLYNIVVSKINSKSDLLNLKIQLKVKMPV